MESILAPVSGVGSGVGYGNDELALELCDIYCAAEHMREWGEILDAEAPGGGEAARRIVGELERANKLRLLAS